MKKSLASIFAISTCLLLAACSSANFAYNNAPRYIANQFEDAFDLNPDQTGQLDTQIQQFFVWHRKEELGRYQESLRQAATTAENGFSAEEFLRVVDDIRRAWKRSLAMVIDNIGGLATTLSPEQIKHFEAYYRETTNPDEDYFEKPPEQRRLLRAELSLERLQGWYGDFDNALEDRVLARLQQLPNAYEPWLEFRDAQVSEMVRIFSTAPSPDVMRTQLHDLLLNPDHPISREFEPTRVAYWKAYAEMLEEINGWLTPEQQLKAVTRLQKFARMVSDIDPQG